MAGSRCSLASLSVGPWPVALSLAAALVAALAAPARSGERSAASAVGQDEAAGDPAAPAWSDVRRVFETRCIECHGGEARKGLLSLASAETFAQGGGHGALVDAERPERSLLLKVISYVDPELSMPPSGQLPEEERALLEAWVRAGAPWPSDDTGRLADPTRFPLATGIDLAAGADWWAYRPLVAPAVPDLAPVPDNAAWSANPIDRFVKARLDAQGLAPAPRADDATLLRRLHFDLCGLPPTPAERSAFAADVRARGFEAAWAAEVERLLTSDTHAEHWARHWLDLVRFAETNGYERDGTKVNVWRYRDWVVRAVRSGMPYDQFVRLQLAGDELVDLPGEGPVEAEFADAALATGYFRLVVWDDEPSDRLQAHWDEIADIADTTGQVFLGTTMGCARCHDHKADPVSQRDYYAFTAFFNNIDGYRYGGERDVADPPGPGVLSVPQRDAALAELEARIVAEGEASGALDTLYEAPRVLVPDARSAAHTWRALELDEIGAGPAAWETPGFDDSGWDERRAGFGDPSTPGSIVGTHWFTPQILLRTTFALDALPKSLVLSVHYDDDTVVHLNGVPIASFQGYVTEYQELELGPEALAALVVGRNVLAVSCLQDFGGRYVDVGLRTGSVDEPNAVVRIANNVAAAPDEPRFAAVRDLLSQRRALLATPVAAPYPAQVVRENGARAPRQHVFGRGSAHAPGEEVAPRLPEVFANAAGSIEPPLPRPEGDAPSSGRRLALANWLVGEGAFLTARVHANRVWQFHMGRGLCRTPGDFGRLGERPTHPELLDHLALVLVESGWSQLELHRAILTSRTYQASSVGPQGSLDADPRNDHLWRFEPQRLTAEAFRDSVLAVSGTLTQRLFGPSVYPPMDPAVLATASRPNEAWGSSSPEDARRRSLYIFTKRSLRFPLLEALDQASPDSPCPERFLTNVPTQALMTLNGPFTTGAAADLARRLEREAGDDLSAQLALGIELALARTPSADELARQVAFVEGLVESRALSAAQALEVWCLGLFNRNEFTWVD